MSFKISSILKCTSKTVGSILIFTIHYYFNSLLSAAQPKTISISKATNSRNSIGATTKPTTTTTTTKEHLLWQFRRHRPRKKKGQRQKTHFAVTNVKRERTAHFHARSPQKLLTLMGMGLYIILLTWHSRREPTTHVVLYIMSCHVMSKVIKGPV